MLTVYQRIYLFLHENSGEFVKYNDSNVVVAIQANSEDLQVYPYKVHKSHLLSHSSFIVILDQQPLEIQNATRQALTNPTENCLLVEVDGNLLHLFYDYTLEEISQEFLKASLKAK